MLVAMGACRLAARLRPRCSTCSVISFNTRSRPDEQEWPTLSAVWSADAPDATYLVLRKTDTIGRMSLLLRRDAHGTQRLDGTLPLSSNG